SRPPRSTLSPSATLFRSLLSAVFGVGGGLGIVFSGLIVDHLSWRWLFILGAIPVAISVVLVHRFVPESPIKTPSRIDYLGASLRSEEHTSELQSRVDLVC